MNFLPSDLILVRRLNYARQRRWLVALSVVASVCVCGAHAEAQSMAVRKLTDVKSEQPIYISPTGSIQISVPWGLKGGFAPKNESVEVQLKDNGLVVTAKQDPPKKVLPKGGLSTVVVLENERIYLLRVLPADEKHRADTAVEIVDDSPTPAYSREIISSGKQEHFYVSAEKPTVILLPHPLQRAFRSSVSNLHVDTLGDALVINPDQQLSPFGEALLIETKNGRLYGLRMMEAKDQAKRDSIVKLTDTAVLPQYGRQETYSGREHQVIVPDGEPVAVVLTTPVALTSETSLLGLTLQPLKKGVIVLPEHGITPAGVSFQVPVEGGKSFSFRALPESSKKKAAWSVRIK